MKSAAGSPASSIAINSVLVAITLGLVALNWSIMNWSIDISPATPEHQAVVAPQMRNATPPQSPKRAAETSVAEALGRPLFNPERRPQVAPEPAKAPVRLTNIQPPPLEAHFVGLTSTAAKGKRILIRLPTERDGVWLAVGEVLSGWKLRDIGTDAVVFENGTQTQVIAFEPKR